MRNHAADVKEQKVSEEVLPHLRICLFDLNIYYIIQEKIEKKYDFISF